MVSFAFASESNGIGNLIDLIAFIITDFYLSIWLSQ